MVTDIKVFVEGLQVNTTLTELDFSRNDISDKLGLAKGLAESLKVSLLTSPVTWLQISKYLWKVCRSTPL